MSLFAFVQNYWILLVLVVIAGLGNIMFHPNAYQQIYQFSTQANRGTLLSVGGGFGYGAAPIVAGALLVWGRLPALIYLLVPGIVIAGVISHFPQKPVYTQKSDLTATVERKLGSKKARLMLRISSLRTWVYYRFLAFATILPHNICGC